MLKIRQSALNSYEICPYLCFKEWGVWGVYSPREDNEEVSTNKYALTGIAFHETMEEWGKRAINGDKLSREVEIGYLHQHLQTEINKIDQKYFEDKEDRNNFEASLHTQLDWVFENYLLGKPLKVEHNFDLEIFPDMPNFTGTIDRIDGVLETRSVDLFDYKTGKVATKKDLSSNIQAGLYSMAFNKEFGFYPRSFTFIYTKHRKIKEIMITREFLEASRQRIFEILDKIKNNQFNPPKKVNRFFCKNFCNYIKECPKYVSPKGWENVK